MLDRYRYGYVVSKYGLMGTCGGGGGHKVIIIWINKKRVWTTYWTYVIYPN